MLNLALRIAFTLVDCIGIRLYAETSDFEDDELDGSSHS